MSKELTEKAVAEATELLKKSGVPSFILLFQPVAGLTTSHLQDMKVKDALSMVAACFKQVVKLELELNPQASKEYQKALLEMLSGFQLLIKDTNEKIKLIENIPVA